MLSFGKYRAVKLCEIPPSYLRWILQKVEVGSKLTQENYDDIMDILSKDDIDEDVTFGKYKGHRLSSIMHDESYVNYVKNWLSKPENQKPASFPLMKALGVIKVEKEEEESAFQL